MKTSFVKKFMVIALALAMVFTFAACGGSNDSGSGDGSSLSDEQVLEEFDKLLEAMGESGGSMATSGPIRFML